MSGERAPSPGRGKGPLLLRGSRSRSYGSLIRSPRSPVSPVSPVRQRRLEHTIQPGETLQGLALKYGVTMEEIKRANRLYTNDSIFLKKSLLIPVLSDWDGCSNRADLAEEDCDGASVQNCSVRRQEEEEEEEEEEGASSDLTPVDFLKRLDDLISQSKQAAAKGRHQAEERVAALEAACASRTSAWRPLTRSQSVTPSPRMHQQGAPLTMTKLTKNPRDREDEIFEL